MFDFAFMQRALAAAVLVGLLCGILGFFVVLRRLAFIGVGISHSAIGGVAIGILAGWNPLVTGAFFAVAVALGIALVSQSDRISEDTVIGVFFSGSMALGIVLFSMKSGYQQDLFSYLFGNVLAISTGELVALSCASAVIVAIIPLTTILLTHWVVPGETFRIARLPGLAMAIGGIAVMGWAPVGQPSSRWILGIVLMTGGALSAGLGGALTRRYAVRHRNAPLIVSQYLTSAVILALLSIPFDGYQGYLTIDPAGLWLIVYMGVVPTAISFAAFMWACRVNTAARASLTGYFSPLLGVTLAVVLLSEPVTLQLALGMIAVAIGIVVSDRPDRQDDRRRAASAGPPAAGILPDHP